MATSRAWSVGNILRGIIGDWSVSGNLTAGGVIGPVTGPVSSSAVTISGGTINATPIGATTPSTGAFTAVSINTTSSVWNSQYSSVEFALGAIAYKSGAGNNTSIFNNCFIDTSGFYQYKSTGGIAHYSQNGNVHYFYSGSSQSSGTTASSISTPLSFANGYAIALEGALLNTGTGITFPATQVPSANPNTLDDYEEGTWTPGLGSMTVVGSPSAIGSYTKVGRQVTARCTLLCSPGNTVACTSGTSNISGLPFANNATYDAAGVWVNVSANVGGQTQIADGGSSLYPTAFTAQINRVVMSITYDV
jgi:hypothetical protein